VFQLTNGTDHLLIFACLTQVATNGPGFWQLAKSQRQSWLSGQQILGGSTRTFAFPTPAEGRPWRVLVVYARPTGKIEAWIDKLLATLRIHRTTRASRTVVSAEIGE
jgi:hypothetical protein